MSLRKTKETFIEEAVALYGNTYDYSKVEYVNNNTKVCIICPEHGEFYKSPKHHLQGQGCPKCKFSENSNKRKMSKEDFLIKSNEIHFNKYNYSKVEYVNNNTKVCIICPIHGEFWQTPQNHLSGHNCPKCSKHFVGNTEYFIERAKEIHNNKYDYSNSVYTKSSNKLAIICPEHGEFFQTPNDHLSGKGCPKCGIEKMALSKRRKTNDFIKIANDIHNFRYNYNHTEYKDSFTHININCPIHGIYKQLPYVHLLGFGCPKCSNKHKYTNDEFIQEARKIHNDKYDYSNTEYFNSHTKIKINCPYHGEFWQLPYCHIQGEGCPKCSHTFSKAEEELASFIIDLGFDIERNNKTILDGKEIDIFIPQKKIGIEYDGLIWHSEKFGKDIKYHLNKTELCEKQNIRLIHIFEDEWLQKKDILKYKLKRILYKCQDLKKIYARKCNVIEIDENIVRDFLLYNALENYTETSIHIGCYYNEMLIGVIGFYNIEGNNWKISNLATHKSFSCIGVIGKMFKYFLKEYSPLKVYALIDRRYGSLLVTNVYEKLGFLFEKNISPKSYLLVNKEHIENNNKEKSDNTIYDCGYFSYVFETY